MLTKGSKIVSASMQHNLLFYWFERGEHVFIQILPLYSNVCVCVCVCSIQFVPSIYNMYSLVVGLRGEIELITLIGV